MKRHPRQTSSIDDAELAAALKGLREDVAAPAGFRSRVLARLAEQGVLEGPAKSAQPSWVERAWQAFTPARLALGGAALAALLVVVVGQRAKAPQPQGPALAQAPKDAPSFSAPGKAFHASAKKAEQGKAVASAPAPQPARGRADTRSAPAAQAGAPEAPADAWQVIETSEQASAPVLPSASAAAAPAQGALQSRPGAAVAAASQPQAGVASQAKPIEVMVKPSPTPLAKPVLARSEVRQNVARLSRGQQALIYVKLEAPGKVRVSVVDRLGRLVAVLKDGDCPAGVSEIRWGGQKDDGSVAATGVYQVQVRAPGFEDRHKLMLVK